MNPKFLLRIAAIFLFLHTIGHTFGALSWRKAPNDAIAQVINAMQTNHFYFMGISVSLASYYEGYGIIMIFVLLLVSLTLWFLSNEVANPLAARLLTPMVLFLIIMAITEYIYFFPFAAMFTLLAGICSLVARIRQSSL
jgi:hypothetical protein